MACCWEPGFLGNSLDEIRFWVDTTPGWLDLLMLQPQDPSVIFSGVPDWIGGNDGLTAWRVYQDATRRFLSYQNTYQHHGNSPETPSYMRTWAGERFGGTAPVAVFVVPDYYLNYVRLDHRNKFVWAEGIDYTGDLNVDIPMQLMSHPFFSQWRNWRDNTPGQGVPADRSGVYF